AVIAVFIGAITAINLRSVVRGALASNVLTVLKITPLLLLALAGVWVADPTPTSFPAPLSCDVLGSGTTAHVRVDLRGARCPAPAARTGAAPDPVRAAV